ncbi:type-F conjugative transfer system pilin assembly protein TrbC [Legionella pneumophila]|uniref:type-F conjugative transfer system pilin assembly protein TrbC n=1 Tax=Legionella pneumophila TaxID=446 RepID=UPI0029B30631|nr:type-F conjugative transfer system pilin assembly protein TrbC [Legionella pneumophila]MDX1850404.1 type-F conjugative transfer system pilin assembly protein TrbC [Legionella pneumophila]
MHRYVKSMLVFMIVGVSKIGLCAASIHVFVSFSMPDKFLEETLRECSQLSIPVYLNGLYRDSMSETALKVMALSKRTPNLNLNIDPTLFERFDIHQVPALVVDDGKNFDVIYGHLTIQEGLTRMAGRGEVYFTSKNFRRLR